MFLLSEEIEKYVSIHSSEEFPLLKELAEETEQKMEIPQMMTGNTAGQFLAMLVKLHQPKRVLEIGTFTGYSALAMALALPDEGKIVTCDCDEKATEIAKAYWAKSDVHDKIDLRMGNALETLRNLTELFDMVFIDADKENYIAYWDAIIPKMSEGGLIVVDNVLWSGRVLNPKDETDKAIHKFNEHVKKDIRVEHMMVTIRDGMTLARKRL